MTERGRHQKGAALLVVLLLAGTLSFIALALVRSVTASAQRSAGAALRAELLWRAVSAEEIAIAAIEGALQATSSGGPQLTPAHPLFSEQLRTPLDRGEGALIFADASTCFNLNSLSVAPAESAAPDTDSAIELTALLVAVGFAENEAELVSGVVKDWIDPDDIQTIGGAEDNFYTNLPTPYRTASGPIASVTELRAMKGVTDEIYAAASPHLCAPPQSEPMALNINALTPDDAPLLVAASGGAISNDNALTIIADRPPAGWTSVSQFLASPVIEGAEGLNPEAFGGRLSTGPRYIEALAGATVNEIDMSVRLLFAVDPDAATAQLVAREIGTAL
ncbi:MAG: type II secretion system minor pseudopilin GspK [Pseudomonadota bacterium]